LSSNNPEKDSSDQGLLRSALREREVELILLALERSRGNQASAAEHLGIPLRTLVYKLKRLGIRGRQESGTRHARVTQRIKKSGSVA
jgi:DNA-binding NtrC family response regulator